MLSIIKLNYSKLQCTRATMHIHIYIQWFFWKFFPLVLLSIRGYIDSLIHSFHSCFFPPRSRLLPFSKLIDRLSYLQVRNQILTFSEISILLFHSSLELVRSFLLPSSFFSFSSSSFCSLSSLSHSSPPTCHSIPTLFIVSKRQDQTFDVRSTRTCFFLQILDFVLTAI